MSEPFRQRAVFNPWLVLSVTIVFAVVFFLLVENLPRWSDLAVGLVLAVFTVCLGVHDWQVRRHRRAFFVNNHVHLQSRWRPLLAGGWLMLPWSFVKGALFTLTLFAGLLTGVWALYLMLLAPLVVYLARHIIWYWLEGTINRDYLVLFSERLAQWLTLAVLLLAFVWVSFYLPQPDYRGVNVAETASEIVASSLAVSGLISMLKSVNALQEFLFSWAVQNLLSGSENRLLIIVGWASIFLKGSLALLPAIHLALFFQRNFTRNNQAQRIA